MKSSIAHQLFKSLGYSYRKIDPQKWRYRFQYGQVEYIIEGHSHFLKYKSEAYLNTIDITKILADEHNLLSDLINTTHQNIEYYHKFKQANDNNSNVVANICQLPDGSIESALDRIEDLVVVSGLSPLLYESFVKRFETDQQYKNAVIDKIYQNLELFGGASLNKVIVYLEPYIIQAFKYSNYVNINSSASLHSGYYKILAKRFNAGDDSLSFTTVLNLYDYNYITPKKRLGEWIQNNLEKIDLSVVTRGYYHTVLQLIARYVNSKDIPDEKLTSKFLEHVMLNIQFKVGQLCIKYFGHDRIVKMISKHVNKLECFKTNDVDFYIRLKRLSEVNIMLKFPKNAQIKHCSKSFIAYLKNEIKTTGLTKEFRQNLHAYANWQDMLPIYKALIKNIM